MQTHFSSRRTASTFFGFVLLSSALPSSLIAQDTAATASVTVTQKTPTSTVGTWTLLEPGEKEHTFKTATETVSGLPAGNYTLFIDAPAGMTTVVRLLNGSTVLQKNPSPQLSFALPAEASYTAEIEYTMSEFGDMGVTSEPSGVPLELKDPDGMILTGVTPQSFLRMPVGSYTVWYKPAGCPEPPAKSGNLDRNKRLSLNFEFICATFSPANGLGTSSISSSSESSSSQSSRQSSSARSLPVQEPVASSSAPTQPPAPEVAPTEGPFKDVPGNAWYRAAVDRVVKNGIVQGYKDPYGKLTGKFGPENPVLIGEIAKVMTNLGGVKVDFTAIPINVRAFNKWHSSYIAGAEKMGWVVYQNTFIDPERPATRGEVVATLLEALKIPQQEFSAGIFADVKADTPYAAAIITAAAQGFVSGKKDTNGKVIGFDPGSGVTRAELAMILMRVLDQREGI